MILLSQGGLEVNGTSQSSLRRFSKVQEDLAILSKVVLCSDLEPRKSNFLLGLLNLQITASDILKIIGDKMIEIANLLRHAVLWLS